MSKELPKNYDPTGSEKPLYERWLASGFFNPDNLPGERPERFSMVLPPPNVTGTLHMGHALTVTIEDILVRYHRMIGKKALWLPGTDHAAIATESKVERELLKKEGKGRHDLGREEFLNRVRTFAQESQDTILSQLRSMGASLDWSRLAFTLDEPRRNAVRTAFKRMHEAGLIYSGQYLVHWDKKGQTTVSDEEVEYETEQGTLYTFRYSKDFPIAIATTRPETKLGDTAVAVHPDDTRYNQFIGKEYTLTFAGVPLTITIIGDQAVDPVFGTGAVGVTPAHSMIDGEMAKRHGIESKQVINEFGKIINTPGFDGLNIKDARDKVVTWLKTEGLLEKEEVIQHNVGKAQRSGGIVEVLPKRHQFFIDVNKPIRERDGKSLKELMREAVASGAIKITPQHFEKTYFHWIDTLRDWNISRQVWYGHPIPAWYKGDEVHVGDTAPAEDWQPITDTLDTWFSSGLWTFSTLGWPDDTPDLRQFHPTNLLETGYDILFFWVARMILMSSFFLGEVPFHQVYLHGLVRDEQRRKMSKSLGNVIDPLSMIEKYGTDAVRMALIFSTAAGSDIPLAEDKIRGMKHFANKLWNIGRFVLTNLPSSKFQVPSSRPEPKTEADKEILEKLGTAITSITNSIEKLALHEAAQEAYHFVWHAFADVYLEASKPQLQDPAHSEHTREILLYILENSLKLLHPFTPFVTEELWGRIHGTDDPAKLLMIQDWPRP
jgi:valyl-tRNA synthetase